MNNKRHSSHPINQEIPRVLEAPCRESKTKSRYIFLPTVRSSSFLWSILQQHFVSLQSQHIDNLPPEETLIDLKVFRIVYNLRLCDTFQHHLHYLNYAIKLKAIITITNID